jgi:SAM-dependent methyltransferase
MTSSREQEQLRRSWEANASAWTAAVREQRIESRRLVTDTAIVRAVIDQNPRNVLDVGCGEGWLARALASHGVAVTGVDASAALIDAAQSLGGARFLVASYEELVANPIQETFDTVVANFSLLDDRAEELLASLTAGRLVVQTVHPVFAGRDEPYADGWRLETFDGFSGEWRETMPWYFRTVESWSRTLAAAGYSIEEIREPMYLDRVAPASILFICRR